MTQHVPGIPPPLLESGEHTDERNQIRAAYPVLGFGQWQAMAVAANWVAGIGGALASCGPDAVDVAAGSSSTRRFYLWPRAQNASWLWAVEIEAQSASGARGTVTLAPGADAFDWAVADDRAKTFLFPHDPSAIAPGEASVQISNSTTSPGAVRLRTVGVYELPRAYFGTATATVGVHETSCVGGQPIFENTTIDDKFSAQAVFEQTRDASTSATRSTLFSWFNPTGLTTAATAFTGTSNIFHVDPAMQCRLLAAGATTRVVQWAVYANVTGGGAVGEVRVTVGGGTSTITVVTTVAGWHTGLVSVETDSPSESAFIRGGTRDEATFEMRKTAGTSITVHGIDVGETT